MSAEASAVRSPTRRAIATAWALRALACSRRSAANATLPARRLRSRTRRVLSSSPSASSAPSSGAACLWTGVLGLVVAGAVAECRACELVGMPPPGGVAGHDEERPSGAVAAGAPLRPPEREEHLAALLVGVAVEQSDRVAVMVDGLLVGEQFRGAFARGDRVAARRLASGEVRREQEMTRELGRIDALAPVKGLKGLRDPVMQAQAAARADRAVEHLANERVREGEHVDAPGELEHKPGRDGLLECSHDLLVLTAQDLRDDVEAGLAPDDRCGAQHAGRERREPADAAPDDRQHAFGHAEAPQRRCRQRFARRHAGLEQRADRLLDVEGVAVGLLAQASDEVRRDVAAQPVGHECPRRVLVEAVEHEAVLAVLAAQARVYVRERMLGPDLDVAQRPDDEDARELGVPKQVAQQQQRRLVGPVQVVEDEQHRCPPAGGVQQRRHRLEQPVAQRVVRRLGRRLVTWHDDDVGQQPSEDLAVGPIVAASSEPGPVTSGRSASTNGWWGSSASSSARP